MILKSCPASLVSLLLDFEDDQQIFIGTLEPLFNLLVAGRVLQLLEFKPQN